MKRVAFGFSLVVFFAYGAAPAAASHHKFCVPQGTKLGSSCRSHGYANGARAHFKANNRAAYRARDVHHSTRQ
jgi:hypothetical protein